MQEMHTDLILWNPPSARRPPRTMLIAATLLLSLVRTGMSFAEGESAARSVTPGPTVGSRVAIKQPETAFWDGDRRISSRGEIIFRVERASGDYADIGSDEAGIRGWVRSDGIISLELAGDHYSRRVEADPKDFWAYLARGRLALELGDWDHAIADLDQAILLAPGDPRAHHFRGKARAGRKELDAAIADYNEAIRLDPKRALTYRDRGLAWDTKRYFDRAIADLNEAVRLDPGNVALLMTRGKVCSSRGRHNQAMADFEQAIRMRPSDPEGYVARAEELIEDLQAEKAIAESTRAIEIAPTYVKALLVRGKAARRKFDYAGAIDDYAEAARRAPENAEAHRTLAWILATCPLREFRDGARAVREGTRACELTGWKNPDCLNALAAACAEAGDFASAVKWQSRAVENMPPDDPARPHFRRRLFLYQDGHCYRD